MDILSKAKEDYTETLNFLNSLKNAPGNVVEELLFPIHEEVFSRTDCLECANCCKTSPPRITPEDINRISKHLKLSKKAFKKKYTLEDIDGSLSFREVPCKFLMEDNKCAIYEFRPEACKQFPHTHQKGFNRRVSLNAQNTLICPAAYKIIVILEQKLNRNKKDPTQYNAGS